MQLEVVLSLIRQISIFAGGYLVGMGILTSGQWEGIVAFLLTIIPAIWGLAAKWNDQSKIQTLKDDKQVLKQELREEKAASNVADPMTGAPPGGY
jgi:hypothetical protein